MRRNPLIEANFANFFRISYFVRHSRKVRKLEKLGWLQTAVSYFINNIETRGLLERQRNMFDAFTAMSGFVEYKATRLDAVHPS